MNTNTTKYLARMYMQSLHVVDTDVMYNKHFSVDHYLVDSVYHKWNICNASNSYVNFRARDRVISLHSNWYIPNNTPIAALQRLLLKHHRIRISSKYLSMELSIAYMVYIVDKKRHITSNSALAEIMRADRPIYIASRIDAIVGAVFRTDNAAYKSVSRTLIYFLALKTILCIEFAGINTILYSYPFPWYIAHPGHEAWCYLKFAHLRQSRDALKMQRKSVIISNSKLSPHQQNFRHIWERLCRSKLLIGKTSQQNIIMRKWETPFFLFFDVSTSQMRRRGKLEGSFWCR